MRDRRCVSSSWCTRMGLTLLGTPPGCGWTMSRCSGRAERQHHRHRQRRQQRLRLLLLLQRQRQLLLHLRQRLHRRRHLHRGLFQHRGLAQRRRHARKIVLVNCDLGNSRGNSRVPTGARKSRPHSLDFCQRVADNAFHLRRYRSATRTHLINRNSLRAGCLQRSSSMHVVGTGPPSAREKPDRTIYEMTSIEYPNRIPTGPLPFCPAQHRLRRGRNGRSRVFFP